MGEIPFSPPRFTRCCCEAGEIIQAFNLFTILLDVLQAPEGFTSITSFRLMKCLLPFFHSSPVASHVLTGGPQFAHEQLNHETQRDYRIIPVVIHIIPH